MLRFVINHWRRQRGKFILTLVGALIISAGLSLMFNLPTPVKERSNRHYKKNGRLRMTSSCDRREVSLQVSRMIYWNRTI